MRQIVILFKSVSERQLSDPGDQLKQVIDFRKKLEQEKQFLFDTFDDLESLKTKIRRSLAAWLRDHERGITGKITELARPVETHSYPESMEPLALDISTIGAAGRLGIEGETEMAQEAARGVPLAMMRYANALSIRGRRTQAKTLLKSVLSREMSPAERARALKNWAESMFEKASLPKQNDC